MIGGKELRKWTGKTINHMEKNYHGDKTSIEGFHILTGRSGRPIGLNTQSGEGCDRTRG
jgi:hypothetical protein